MDNEKELANDPAQSPSESMETILSRPLQIDPNGLSVLEKRYLRKDSNGIPCETVQEMFHRVATCVANDCPEAKSLYGKSELTRKYYTLLSSLKFLPNSPTFTGAGTPLGQLAACFVLPIADDMGKDSNDGIFCTLRNAALIQQTGGGVGFSFSRIRPKGDVVSASNGKASGPVSFIRVYDAAFGTIAQGGTRRGANMGILRIDHPDIEEFIDCKSIEGTMPNFNISVGVTDAFMNALAKETATFDLINPRNDKVVRSVNPHTLFDRIASAAHKNGEPGVVFLDTANYSNPVPDIYELEATNPCGEQFLGPYENCCLGSINLAKHLKPIPAYDILKSSRTFKMEIDWAELKNTVHIATSFLDNVITANKFVPVVPQLREAARQTRRIGLGYMGLADVFYALGVRYGSAESRVLAEQITEFIRYHAMMQSVDIAKQFGSFPAIKNSVYNPDNFCWRPPSTLPRKWGCPPLNWQLVVDQIKSHGIRNACQTTIAPTGTIATVAGCEGYGCEPVFALAYTRHVKCDEKTSSSSTANQTMDLRYTSPLFLKALKDAKLSDEVIERILAHVCETGSCQAVPAELQLPEHIRNTFVVSTDIPACNHVEMQATLQDYIDNSISKTINLPHSATVQDVKDVYLQAWRMGCKGITVYVTGSRSTVVLETKKTASAPSVPCALKPMQDTTTQTESLSIPSGVASQSIVIDPTFLRKRARQDALHGRTYMSETPIGKAYITINHTPDRQPLEMFLNVGKGGSDVASISEAIGRLTSLVLRIPSSLSPMKRLEEVVGQLEGIGGMHQRRIGHSRLLSLPDSIAQTLKSYILSMTTMASADICPLTVATSADFGSPPRVGYVIPGAASTVPPRALETTTDMETPMACSTGLVLADICPECGCSAFVKEEGCAKCHVCSYSEC